MIIMDLTNSKKDSLQPKDMPLKIRLIEGQHQTDYDVHPMVRKTTWYKEYCENLQKENPNKDPNLPIGINTVNALRNGVNIIYS